MRILLVEDDSLQRKKLMQIIEKNFIDIKIYEASSIEQSMKILNNKNIDLFLVDVNLVDGSGIELGERIRKIERYELTGIVYITSQLIQIVQAFKNTHCYDFITKPYAEEEIIKVVEVFYKRFDNKVLIDKNHIIVPIENGISVKIIEDEIIFIEYSNRKCNIYTVNNMIECKTLTLSKLLDKCKSDTILKSHKSYVVNIRYIKSIEKVYNKLWNIRFTNTEKIAQLSNNYKNEIDAKWEQL